MNRLNRYLSSAWEVDKDRQSALWPWDYFLSIRPLSVLVKDHLNTSEQVIKYLCNKNVLWTFEYLWLNKIIVYKDLLNVFFNMYFSPFL